MQKIKVRPSLFLSIAWAKRRTNNRNDCIIRSDLSENDVNNLIMPFVIVVNVTLSTLSLRFSLRFSHFFKKELTRMQRCQRIKNYHIISLTNVKELFLFCRLLRIKCFFLQAETFEKRKDFLITFFWLQKAFPSLSSLRVPFFPSLRTEGLASVLAWSNLPIAHPCWC